jgi:cellulose synthase/poly-beta-1,6-N-acetylglucosamine synthase-like glycosyltransferase
VIGCTGAIYALRRSAYEPIPEDTLIDDVLVPMQALVRGGRILFEPEAKAYDPQTLAPEQEQRRKTRTLAGNYQLLFRHPSWLLPWRNRCWWQLISHKYSRLAGPFLLALCLVSTAVLARDSIFFRLALAAQSACYLCGLLGLALPRIRRRWLAIPAGFLFLQWQCLRSLAHYLGGLRGGGLPGRWSA